MASDRNDCKIVVAMQDLKIWAAKVRLFCKLGILNHSKAKNHFNQLITFFHELWNCDYKFHKIIVVEFRYLWFILLTRSSNSNKIFSRPIFEPNFTKISQELLTTIKFISLVLHFLGLSVIGLVRHWPYRLISQPSPKYIQ